MSSRPHSFIGPYRHARPPAALCIHRETDGGFIRARKGKDGPMTSDPSRVARPAHAGADAASRRVRHAARRTRRRRPAEYLASRRSTAVKFTRAAALWSALIVGFLILILLLVFIMQNTDSTTVQLLRLAVESAGGRGDPVRRGVRWPADRRRRHRANLPAAHGPPKKNLKAIGARPGHQRPARRDPRPSAGRRPCPLRRCRRRRRRPPRPGTRCPLR